MKNKSILYLIYLVVFTAIFDFAAGMLYKNYYFSEVSKRNDPLIHSLLGTKEDILIFGSSRALHHYNPKIFQDSLEMSCYNVGSNGQNIYYHLALLEASLERYIPKIAILELMSIDFEQTPSQWDTEKLGKLLPFFEESKSAKKAVLRRGTKENIKTLSAVYPFNSTQYTIIRNNFFPFDNHINGHIPISQVWGKKIEKNTKSQQRTDKNKIDALEEFIKICQDNKLSLFIFISPQYIDNQYTSRYSKLIDQIKAKCGVQIINFEDDSCFLLHPELFADPQHLNKCGANEYTRQVCKIIGKQLESAH